MKKTSIVIAVLLVIVTSCKLGSSHASYSNAPAYITAKQYPDTGILNQPFQIVAVAKAYEGYWYNLQINLYTQTDSTAILTATADYDTDASPVSEISCDTVLKITPKKKGYFVITTRTSPETAVKDTVYIKAQ